MARARKHKGGLDAVIVVEIASTEKAEIDEAARSSELSTAKFVRQHSLRNARRINAAQEKVHATTTPKRRSR